MSEYFSIRWMGGVVNMLDQRFLPDQVIYCDFTTSGEIAMAIRDMVIRGAPAIGIAAGYGLALTAWYSHANQTKELESELSVAAEELRNSRPTAINLYWAIQRMLNVVKHSKDQKLEDIKQLLVEEALKIAEEDKAMNLKIAQNGQQFIPEQANVIHHCNTGTLATGGIGTALGVIRLAHEMGKNVHVYVDETRPRLQGARLTAWELKQLDIPHTVIADGASGYIMKHNKIDACLVGCDRIAANGDVANKIGTYNLAIVAAAHSVPFYSVGPVTSIDLTVATGEEIPIEERSPREVTHIGDTRITPEDVNVANPAFDVTPAKYLTAIITDRGVARPPYEISLKKIMNG